MPKGKITEALSLRVELAEVENTRKLHSASGTRRSTALMASCLEAPSRGGVTSSNSAPIPRSTLIPKLAPSRWIDTSTQSVPR